MTEFVEQGEDSCETESLTIAGVFWERRTADNSEQTASSTAGGKRAHRFVPPDETCSTYWQKRLISPRSSSKVGGMRAASKYSSG